MLMIETHSELLIRELQLRISKGKMNKKDFSILHFSKYKGETKVKRLTLNSKGIIKTPLPADFFDTTIPVAKQLTESKHELNYGLWKEYQKNTDHQGMNIEKPFNIPDVLLIIHPALNYACSIA